MSIIPPIGLYPLSVVLLFFVASCTSMKYQSNQQETDQAVHTPGGSVDKQKIENQDESSCLVCFNEIPMDERLVFCPNVRESTNNKHLLCIDCIQQLAKLSKSVHYTCPLCKHLILIANIDVVAVCIKSIKRGLKPSQWIAQYPLMIMDALKKVKDLDGLSALLHQLLKMGNILLEHGYLDDWERYMVILKKGYQIEINYCQDSLVHVAAKYGYKKVLERLINLFPIYLDINSINHRYMTPLYCAVRNNQSEIVQLLLVSDQIDLAAVEGCGGEYLLYVAIHNGDLAMVKLLMESKQIQLNAMDGYNVLHCAIIAHHLDIVNFLTQSENRYKVDGEVW